jgi:hypothetical protein
MNERNERKERGMMRGREEKGGGPKMAREERGE